jgi:hypothetical protein
VTSQPAGQATTGPRLVPDRTLALLLTVCGLIGGLAASVLSIERSALAADPD